VFARGGPKDRRAKERRGLTGGGKGPKQGVREAVSMDRQKARTEDSSPQEVSTFASEQELILSPEEDREARMVTSLG
jgi:hypothetical protein